MTWARKGNAIHVKSQKLLKDVILPVLVHKPNVDKNQYFRYRVSIGNLINYQFKQLGFRSIRRKQGDEYFYNNDIGQKSLAKVFKKIQTDKKPKLPAKKAASPERNIAD